MKKKFKAFMKDHGAWDKWKANLTRSKEEIFKSKHHNYISNAFLWSESPQGHEYWSELAEKWSDLIL